MDEHPEDLNGQARSALQAGRLSEAISLYGRAMALDRLSPVYATNRAIARLKAGDAAGAIVDADTAIENKRDHAKAYSVKGSALLQLGRVEEAVRVLERGLDFDPANDSMTRNLRDARARMSSGAPASGGPSSAPRPGSLASLMPASLLARGIVIAQLGVTAMTLGYVLTSFGPFGLNAAIYGYLLIVAAITHVLQLAQRHGLPSFTAQYAQAIIMDSTAHLVFLPLVFLMIRPSFMCVLVCVFMDLLAASDWLYAALCVSSPTFARTLATAVARGVARLPPPPGRRWEQLSTREAWAGVCELALQLSALLEVLIGIQLVCELLTPSRSLLAVIMMWQTLQLRFMTSEHTRKAFTIIDSRILSLTAHPWCPRALASVYESIRKALRSQAKTPEDLQREAAAAQAAGGDASGAAGGLAGLARSCVVM